jgi:hypothetical protein
MSMSDSPSTMNTIRDIFCKYGKYKINYEVIPDGGTGKSTNVAILGPIGFVYSNSRQPSFGASFL